MNLNNKFNYSNNESFLNARSFREYVPATSQKINLQQDMTFRIKPCSSTQFIDLKNSYVKFRIHNASYTTDDMGANKLNKCVRLDGGAYAVLNSLNISHQGTQLDSIQNYNNLFSVMMDYNSGFSRRSFGGLMGCDDNADTTNNWRLGAILSATDSTSSGGVYSEAGSDVYVPGSGFHVYTSNYGTVYGSGSSSKRQPFISTFCLPILGSFFGMDKYFPLGQLKDDIIVSFGLEKRPFILLNSNVLSSAGLETDATLKQYMNYYITEAELVLNIIDVKPEILNALTNSNNGVFNIHSLGFKSHNIVIPQGVISTFDFDLQCLKVNSLRYLLLIPLNTTVLNDVNNTMVFTAPISSRTLDGIGSIQFKYNNNYYPKKPFELLRKFENALGANTTTSQSGNQLRAELFYELIRCFDSCNIFENQGFSNISARQYYSSTLEANDNSYSGSIGSGVVLGYSFENSSNKQIVNTGINTNNHDISIIIKLLNKLDVFPLMISIFGCHDVIYTIQNGQISIFK